MTKQEEVTPSGEQPKFTPGPWKAVGYSPGWWQIEGAEGEQIADVNYSDGLDEPTLYPEEANARLIAASPVLYEAVKELIGVEYRHGSPAKREAEFLAAIEQGRAALALVDAPQEMK
jgi:hypothetical protein